MNTKSIEEAAAEARRFLAKVKAWKAANTVVDVPPTHGMRGFQYDRPGVVESGAVRRASMDLTRSLAAMRRPG